ncbi:hypothetical protein OJJOAM_004854 [Cupriavidus sp. H18C1]
MARMATPAPMARMAPHGDVPAGAVPAVAAVPIIGAISAPVLDRKPNLDRQRGHPVPNPCNMVFPRRMRRP